MACREVRKRAQVVPKSVLALAPISAEPTAVGEEVTTNLFFSTYVDELRLNDTSVMSVPLNVKDGQEDYQRRFQEFQSLETQRDNLIQVANAAHPGVWSRTNNTNTVLHRR
jgi:hypothetical protein